MPRSPESKRNSIIGKENMEEAAAAAALTFDQPELKTPPSSAYAGGVGPNGCSLGRLIRAGLRMRFNWKRFYLFLQDVSKFVAFGLKGATPWPECVPKLTKEKKRCRFRHMLVNFLLNRLSNFVMLLVWSDRRVRKSCRAWKMLRKMGGHSLAKVGFDTTEIEPPKFYARTSHLTPHNFNILFPSSLAGIEVQWCCPVSIARDWWSQFSFSSRKAKIHHWKWVLVAEKHASR